MVVSKQAASGAFFRGRQSIRTKLYSSVKRRKTSTGNTNVPEYAKLARNTHVLIGQKANIGNQKDSFDLEKSFLKSESVKFSEPQWLKEENQSL